MLKSAEERDKQARPFEREMRKFGDLIRNDQAILAQLDCAPDKDSFIRLYCELAAQRGCHFTRDDMLIAVQEQKHGSNWIIPSNIQKMVVERF